MHAAKLFWTLSKKFRGNSEDSFKIYSLSAFEKGGKNMIYQFLTSKYISLFYFDNFGSYWAGGGGRSSYDTVSLAGGVN